MCDLCFWSLINNPVQLGGPRYIVANLAIIDERWQDKDKDL